MEVFKFEDKRVRTVTIENQPYFVGKDIAKALGYKNTKDALAKRVDKEDKRGSQIATPSGKQKMTVINESGLYSLILSSKLPNAKEFKRWVTSEVIPAIRKHGAYMTPEKIEEALLNPDTIIKLASELKEEQAKNKALVEKLEVANEKATYLDSIIESKDSILATQIAQDYGLSAMTFNKKLNELRIQRKVNGQWILYREHQGKGYIDSRTTILKMRNGKLKTVINTVWTQKGRLFLYNKLKDNGVLPLVEREE